MSACRGGGPVLPHGAHRVPGRLAPSGGRGWCAREGHRPPACASGRTLTRSAGCAQPGTRKD